MDYKRFKSNILFTLLTLIISEVCVASLTCADLFLEPAQSDSLIKNLIDRGNKSALQIQRALQSKYFMRILNENGPILQPNFFKAIEPDSHLQTLVLQPTDGRVHREDRSVPSTLMRQKDRISLTDLCNRIVARAVPLPLVFKPNMSAVGRGIIFIEVLNNRTIVLTMAIDNNSTFEESKRVRDRFIEKGLAELVHTNQDNTISFRLELPKNQLVQILKEVFEIVSYTETPTMDGNGFHREYDSGMIEFKMEFFKYLGRAYETRHEFTVNLASGQVEVSTAKSQHLLGSFARIGSSSYFSNQTARKDVHVLPYEKMFDPLFAVFNIPVEKHQMFFDHVNKLVQKQALYVRNRLVASGISFNGQLRGEFDLMWLPPNDKSQGFPRPVLIESLLHGDQLHAQFGLYLNSIGFSNAF